MNVYTAIDYVKPYVGLSYLTDASSEIKFDDNLSEHVGFIITATDYLNIALDYEFSQTGCAILNLILDRVKSYSANN